MIETIYVFHCAAEGCEQEQKHRYGLAWGAVPVYPTVPDGWLQLMGRFYCPRHQIRVTVDEHEIFAVNKFLLAPDVA